MIIDDSLRRDVDPVVGSMNAAVTVVSSVGAGVIAQMAGR